jgi:hypothetical protein
VAFGGWPRAGSGSPATDPLISDVGGVAAKLRLAAHVLQLGEEDDGFELSVATRIDGGAARIMLFCIWWRRYGLMLNDSSGKGVTYEPPQFPSRFCARC